MTSPTGKRPVRNSSPHPDATTGRPVPAAPPGGGRRGLRGARQALAVLRDHYRPHSTTALRVSVGMVFVWFGVMKFFPGLSPAESVATRTMDVLTFGLVPARVSYPLLALLETAIGVGLITGVWLRLTLAAFFAHMAGVFSALLSWPTRCGTAPYPHPPSRGSTSSRTWCWSSPASLSPSTNEAPDGVGRRALPVTDERADGSAADGAGVSVEREPHG
ncbi:DoxX family protein [Streptomyces sp. NPDC006339]|uniref:DoxX family protein n=1 Tax=Streptomyces sp. NPDC006339 TaxID=3156755 RepID=UPI0033AAEE21